MLSRHTLALCLAVMCGAISVRADTVIHVDYLAPGINDGTSWENAFTDLQDALDAAAAMASETNLVELWIAEGTYRPDRGTGDRNATFNLNEYTSLLGGFAGWEWLASQRDITANETTLSGDLLGNDDYDFEPTSDCCSAHATTGCDDESCSARVAQFPAAQGCYPLQDWSSQCQTFAYQVCCDLCRPSRCENSYRVVTLISMTGPVVLDGLTITGGEADGAVDGQMDVFKPAHAAGMVSWDSYPAIRNCTFWHNGAPSSPALYLSRGSAVVEKCRFTENQSYGGYSLTLGENTTYGVLITDTMVDHNYAGGIGIVSYTNQTQVRNCDIINNFWIGIYVNSSAPAVLFSRIVGNSGSGIENIWGFPLIGNCEIRNNVAPDGAGVNSTFADGLILVNSLIENNQAVQIHPLESAGGGVSNILSSANILNCTIVSNAADRGGGVASNEYVAIHNSILWGNTDLSGSIQSAQFRNNPVFGTHTLLYNSVEGWDDTLVGTGNNGFDPSFVDPIGPDGLPFTGDENYRLSPASSLINAGHPAPPLVPYLDMDGHTRILCGRVDIGAYEFGIADYDCSGIVDLMDFMTLPSCMGGPTGALVPIICEAFDFNADNLIDLSDVAGFQNALTGP